LRGLHSVSRAHDRPQSNSIWEIAMKKEPDYADYRSHVEKALQRRSEDLGEIVVGLFREIRAKVRSISGWLAPSSGASKRRSAS
jgi:hypothetical protein